MTLLVMVVLVLVLVGLAVALVAAPVLAFRLGRAIADRRSGPDH